MILGKTVKSLILKQIYLNNLTKTDINIAPRQTFGWSVCRSMIINNRKDVSIHLLLSWLFSTVKFDRLKFRSWISYVNGMFYILGLKVKYLVGLQNPYFHLNDLSERKSQNPLLAVTPQINSSFPTSNR